MVQSTRVYRVAGKKDGQITFECVSNARAIARSITTSDLKGLGFKLSELKKGTKIEFERYTGHGSTAWIPSEICE